MGPHPSNTLTTMLSHPGSVDVLDGTSPTITGLGYEAHLMQHNLSNNTLSPFTVSKPNSKQLISQNSYQGTPTGYSHSRNASMTASMEVIYIKKMQNLYLGFFNLLTLPSDTLYSKYIAGIKSLKSELGGKLWRTC